PAAVPGTLTPHPGPRPVHQHALFAFAHSQRFADFLRAPPLRVAKLDDRALGFGQPADRRAQVPERLLREQLLLGPRLREARPVACPPLVRIRVELGSIDGRRVVAGSKRREWNYTVLAGREGPRPVGEDAEN